MRKSILSAVAAGALAVGGAASAQDLGTVIGNLLGFGTPSYSYGYGTPSYSYGGVPAVVAGTQPYSQVYVDQYGRQVYVDQYGRHVLVQQPSTSTYGITGYDAWGRPIYGTTYGSTTYGGTYGSYAQSGRYWDRDGDGVANTRDRWPDNSRFW